MTVSSDIRVLEVPEVLAGMRLDRALAELMPDVSRSRVQRWIADGHVQISADVVLNQRTRVETGQQIAVTPVFEAVLQPEPQAIALDIVYEDADCLVINKPAGLVVHPGAGQPNSTLQNALLHFDPELERLPRAGLIHRLDKLTSGLLVVARNPAAHHVLTKQMQAREVSREYLALVWGTVIAGGTIDEPLGRHPNDRTRFSVQRGGRDAVTHYRVRQRWPHFSLLDVKLETGRTHQIRVHMQSIGFPLVGDPQYGRRGHRFAGASDELVEALGAFSRQALHARRLAFEQPTTLRPLAFEAEMPEDLLQLIAVVEAEDGDRDA